MAKRSERERVKDDQSQIAQSTKVYNEWADLYSCDMLEEYYYGKQWQGDDSEWQKRKYVINMFYPSINISKATTLFQTPTFKVTPEPFRQDDSMSDVYARAKLQEQALNTYAPKKSIGFDLETGLAMLDAEFRYGVVRVGYTADFIDNPNMDKPMLTTQVDDQGRSIPMTDSDGATVKQSKVKMTGERLFLEWIPAKTCRWSVNSTNRASSNDWFAYFKWYYADDLKRNPRYSNTKDLQPTGRVKGTLKDEGQGVDTEAKNNMVKVWFKWDLRTKERRIWADGAEKYLMTESFAFFPFAILKHDEILGQFYPLPHTYNWVHPQNEKNDTREMQRIHRHRMIRRYLRRAGAFSTEEEFQKLMEGDDGVTAEVTGDPSTALVPVQDAPLDSAVARNLPQTDDDFVRISGISGEAQQVAQSDTATQANLIAMAGRVRESYKTKEVGQFLSDIGRLMLLTMRNKMALPVWIKMAVDPDSPLAAQTTQDVEKLWKQIEGEDLGDIDNDVSVIISSMSPVSQTEERNEWLQFLQLMVNPQLGAVLSQSPALLRKTAGLFNIHSEADLREVSKAMQAAAMMFAQAQAQAMAAKTGGAPGMVTPQPGVAGPGPTPSNGDIAGQLGQQLPVEMNQRMVQ